MLVRQHGAAIVELLGGGIGVLPKLNLRHRHESGERHPDRAPDDALLRERRIEHPRGAEAVLEAEGGRVHSALGPTSSPNSSIRGLPRSSASRVRRIAVSMLMRGPSGAGTSLAGGGRYPDAARPPRREWIGVPSGLALLSGSGSPSPIRLRQRQRLREAGFRFGARACSTSAISFSVSLPARRKA